MKTLRIYRIAAITFGFSKYLYLSRHLPAVWSIPFYFITITDRSKAGKGFPDKILIQGGILQ